MVRRYISLAFIIGIDKIKLKTNLVTTYMVLNLIEFRGGKLFESEVEFLLDIESLPKRFSKVDPEKFRLVNDLKPYTSNMAFTVEDSHISGICLNCAWITSIPDSIRNLTYLKILNLSTNTLRKIPEYIGKFKSLECLNLIRTKLESLPDTIGELKSLKRLYLSYNLLETLPDSIGDLKSLEVLSIHNNKLKVLPESIGNLKSLKILNLNKNQLQNIPESIGSSCSLTTLWLRHNNLTELPDFFDKLVSLRALFIDNNDISSLPPSIGSLESLEIIDLSNNKFNEIPDYLCKLKSLKELFLVGNKRLRISECMKKMQEKQLFICNDDKEIDLNYITGKIIDSGSLNGIKKSFISSKEISLIDLKSGMLLSKKYYSEWREIQEEYYDKFMTCFSSIKAEIVIDILREGDEMDDYWITYLKKIQEFMLSNKLILRIANF